MSELNETNNIIKTKHLLYKQAYETCLKLFITTLIFSGLSLVLSILPAGLSTISSAILVLLTSLAVIVLCIFLLVFFFSYLSKLKQISKFSGKPTLKTSANMILISTIASMVLGIVYAIVLIVLSVNSVYSYIPGSNSMDFPGLPNFTPSYLPTIIIITAILIVLLIACSIVGLIGQLKEFKGHMIEVEDIDSDLVSAFGVAKTWFIVNIIVGILVGILNYVITLLSLSTDILHAFIILANIVISFLTFYYKLSALKKTVAVLEAQITE